MKKNTYPQLSIYITNSILSIFLTSQHCPGRYREYWVRPGMVCKYYQGIQAVVLIHIILIPLCTVLLLQSGAQTHTDMKNTTGHISRLLQCFLTWLLDYYPTMQYKEATGTVSSSTATHYSPLPGTKTLTGQHYRGYDGYLGTLHCHGNTFLQTCIKGEIN